MGTPIGISTAFCRVARFIAALHLAPWRDARRILSRQAWCRIGQCGPQAIMSSSSLRRGCGAATSWRWRAAARVEFATLAVAGGGRAAAGAPVGPRPRPRGRSGRDRGQAARRSRAPSASTARTSIRACSWGVAPTAGERSPSRSRCTWPWASACRASKPAKKRWPVGTVFIPREERSRSRVGTWLRSMGFVVSPCARWSPVRLCVAAGKTSWTARRYGW